MEGYKVTIVENSNPNMSKKELVQLKTDPGEKLDALAPIVLEDVTGYARLHVVNPLNKENPEYDHFVVTTAGGRFYTGSPSFMDAFMTIYDEMEGETDWGIEVRKQDSKNRQGKQFLTCVLV